MIINCDTDRTSMLQKEIRFREQVQETAEAAQREAEAAEAAKSRFLANMSHGMKEDKEIRKIGDREGGRRGERERREN